AQIVSGAWIDTATTAQIRRSQSQSYGYQFWLGSSHLSGRRIDWVAAMGQGGQRIFIVPTLDLVIVVTAGNYYGKDLLSSLVPEIVRDDYVLPAVETVP